MRVGESGAPRNAGSIHLCLWRGYGVIPAGGVSRSIPGREVEAEAEAEAELFPELLEQRVRLPMPLLILLPFLRSSKSPRPFAPSG